MQRVLVFVPCQTLQTAPTDIIIDSTPYAVIPGIQPRIEASLRGDQIQVDLCTLQHS